MKWNVTFIKWGSVFLNESLFSTWMLLWDCLLVNDFFLIIFLFFPLFPLSLSHRSCSVPRYGFPFTSCVCALVFFLLHSHFPNSLFFTAVLVISETILLFLVSNTLTYSSLWMFTGAGAVFLQHSIFLFSNIISFSPFRTEITPHSLLCLIQLNFSISQSTFTPDMQSFPLANVGTVFVKEGDKITHLVTHSPSLHSINVFRQRLSGLLHFVSCLLFCVKPHWRRLWVQDIRIF